MPLGPGARFGPYEVVGLIGAGGMGEVYRALDPRLKREVALKIVSQSFAADPDRLARFQREAQVLAALNHPNIAHVYGLEQSEGVQALVMELVEGPTLADRIAKGPIPLDETVPIARQIAEALETAHEQGIIHRDLKPANIKLRPDGVVKVLDFGLAKALEPPMFAGRGDATASPTITSPAMMTGVGVLLGTAAYMSPEQARGKTVDKRTDIWAFGCVLYQMLTGRRAFEGEDVSDTLAFIITKDPDWSALAPDLPAALGRLLRRCLEKDRTRRLQHIGDARLELEEALTAPVPVPDAAAPRSTRWTHLLPWTLATAFATALLLTTIVTFTARPGEETAADRPVSRLELTLPAGLEFFAAELTGPNVAVSPDGTQLAFVGVRGGLRQIYLRHLGDFEATLVRGSETASFLFFSPDGQSIGFIANDQGLRAVSLADGGVEILARGVDYGGATWTTDGRIVFARGGTLWEASASASGGDAARQLTTLDAKRGETAHRWPAVVPNNQTVLFTTFTASGVGSPRVEALSRATGERRTVVERGTFPVYAASGHLVFVRDAVLLAAPFNLERLEVTGPPLLLLENPTVSGGAAQMALSGTGSLVYPPGAQPRWLVWVSRQGVEQTLSETRRSYGNPRLAPDGRRVVVDVAGSELWMVDIARDTFTRLTLGQTSLNSYPVWTPDGKRIVFRTSTGLHWLDPDGGGGPQVIPGTSLSDFPNSVSPDGSTLALLRMGPDTTADGYALSLRGEPAPHPVMKTPAYEGGSMFSPDGNWLAYASDESGRLEVYVRPIAGPDRKLLVSTDGGTHPRWNPSGKELFYRNGDNMMAVAVSTNPEMTLSKPQLLFARRYSFGTNITLANFDVSPDGQRFLMVKDDPGAARLNVVLNWTEELKRLVPTN